MASKVADALVAPIVVEYKGKGAKDAEKGLLGLEGVAKKLGKTVAGVFAVTKLIQFGKQSVAAYMADDKAASSLSQTLSNMGLAIQSIGVENFIQKLQNTTGVLDDQLRPAFQSLVMATNDVAKAQDLLSLALDISAGSSYDLESVTQALAKAQNGNMTQLSKMTLGITKAEYATKNFASIQQKLTDLYAGDAAKAADTYAGKMAKVSAAVADAKEQIGKGLLDAFTTLSSSGSSIDQATAAIRNFGAVAQQEIAGLAIGIKQLGTDIAHIPGLGWLITKTIEGWNKALGISDSIQQDIINNFAEISRENTKKLEEYYKNQKAQDALNKKIEKDRIAALNAQNKALKDKLALERASSALKAADKIFDQQAIEIAAAMANQQSKEDMARLQLKKDILDLQAAIDAQDVAAATALADKVNQDILRLNAIRATSQAMETLANPFTNWNGSLVTTKSLIEMILDLINKMNDGANLTTKQIADLNAGIKAITTNTNKAVQSITPTTTPTTQNPILSISTGITPQSQSTIGAVGRGEYNAEYQNPITPQDYIPMDYSQDGRMSVVVNVQGSVTTQQDLVDAITAGLQENSASGVVNTVNRGQQWWATAYV